jgi:type IV pilus assembly protein PilC
MYVAALQADTLREDRRYRDGREPEWRPFQLAFVLLNLASTIEKQVELKHKIKSAMTYPVIVLLAAIVLSTVMLIFIVPVFAAMFDDLGGELPLLTKMLVSLSEFVASPIEAPLWSRRKRAIRATDRDRSARRATSLITMPLPLRLPGGGIHLAETF